MDIQLGAHRDEGREFYVYYDDKWIVGLVIEALLKYDDKLVISLEEIHEEVPIYGLSYKGYDFVIA